jgi:hypothetical protein
MFDTTNLYVTPDDLKSFTRLDSIKNMTDDELIKSILLAQYKIEAFCNQYFYSVDEAKEFDGMDSNLLTLQDRLYEIDSVFINGKSITEKVVLTPDKWGIRLKNEIIFNHNDRQTETITPKFESGVNNIIISGKWGWAVPPNEVKYSACKLAEGLTLIGDDIDSIRAETGVFRRETIGTYTYELKDSKYLTESQSTGDATVDSFLIKYKKGLKKSGMRIGVV